MLIVTLMGPTKGVKLLKIIEVTNQNKALTTNLVDIWEKSVLATHDFLSAKEVATIKKYVPQAIAEVEHLAVAEEDGSSLGFIGIDQHRIEMLFIDPDIRGRGLGKKLIQFMIDNYAVDSVTVNEQNSQAVGFYQHLGFKTYQRTDLDEEGNPYPLLYMKM